MLLPYWSGVWPPGPASQGFVERALVGEDKGCHGEDNLEDFAYLM